VEIQKYFDMVGFVVVRSLCDMRNNPERFAERLAAWQVEACLICVATSERFVQRVVA
jgi:hypothetical protein